MATKKIEIRPKGTGDYADILYPKTSADMVIDEATGIETTSHVKYGGATTGSANTYAVTFAPAPASYYEGLAISFKISVDSTAASTINVNSLGAKSLVKANGSAITNLKANGIYTFRYNSSTGNFIVQGEGGAGNAVASDLLSGKTASTDAGDITGTMPNNGSLGTITPGTNAQAIPAGYTSGGTVAGDANLLATNILSGKSIFGVAGSVVAGSRKANGSVTSSSTTSAFEFPNGTNSSAYSSVTVTGLSFTPSLIFVMQNSGFPQVTIYTPTNLNGASGTYGQPRILLTPYNTTSEGQFYVETIITASPASVTNGSFTLPVGYTNKSYVWYAYE